MAKAKALTQDTIIVAGKVNAKQNVIIEPQETQCLRTLVLQLDEVAYPKDWPASDVDVTVAIARKRVS